MVYYGRRNYRSWRSRRSDNSSEPSKYLALSNLFGHAVVEIRDAFLNLESDALDELFLDYGAIHGDSAERYARKTFSRWKGGSIKLSGQTMERLIELVPPYLSSNQRFELIKLVLKKHQKSAPKKIIRINVIEPTEGFNQLTSLLNSMSRDDKLAHIPERVMNAASWLYDDDVTAARAMLAEVDRIENDQIREKAIREIELLKRTISTGQIKAANYSVQMPTGTLSVVAYTPSLCFVATACFGSDAQETIALRHWRDSVLINYALGRNFISWYYNNGERLVFIANKSYIIKSLAKLVVGLFAKFIMSNQR